MDKLSELKAAAMAATPGPWRALSFDERLGIDGDDGAILVCEHITKQRPQDALFIATANPAVILALLAELEFEKQNNSGVAGMVEDYETKLEAKDTRIAELEAKLATPVRLPTKYSMLHREDFHDDYQSKMVFKADEVIAALRAHGSTVEGDE